MIVTKCIKNDSSYYQIRQHSSGEMSTESSSKIKVTQH